MHSVTIYKVAKIADELVLLVIKHIITKLTVPTKTLTLPLFGANNYQITVPSTIYLAGYVRYLWKFVLIFFSRFYIENILVHDRRLFLFKHTLFGTILLGILQ